MNPEIKEKWIAALRSGNYKKQEGALRMEVSQDTGDLHMGYCCLGVLCEVFFEDKDPNEIWEIETDRDHWTRYGVVSTIEENEVVHLCHEYPPDYVEEPAGLNTEIMETLADMNDSGQSFDEIADYIEEHL